MTRDMEILFRGFHSCKDGKQTIYVEGKAVRGEWVEGFYSHDYLTTEIVHISYWDYENEKSNTDEVLPKTVGQYTGMIDKNGKKIFKGDIIQANFKTPFVVEWDNEGCRFLGFQPNDNSRHFTESDRYICYLSDAREVIGTIFDKPKEETP